MQNGRESDKQTKHPKKKSGIALLLVIIAFAAYIYWGVNDTKKKNETTAEATPTPKPTIAQFTLSKMGQEKGDASTSYAVAPISSIWYTYAPSLHYYYSQLSYAEKRAFSCMYDAIALGKLEQWDISGFGLTQTQRERVRMAVDMDCPELMTAHFSFTAYEAQYRLGNADYFTREAAEIKTLLAKASSALDRVRARGEWGSSAYERQLAYDRYVVKTCAYLLDDDGPEGTKHLDTSVRSAHSALVNKNAVCEGYARSTVLALRSFGIPCIYVYGNTSRGVHAWNMVCVDGQWYQYDATWNDSGDGDLYDDYLPYFNLTDAVMYANRSVDSAYSERGFTLPRCISTAANYYVKKGQYIIGSDSSKLISLLKNAKSSGKHALGVTFSAQSYYNAAVAAIQNGEVPPGFRYTYRRKPEVNMIYFTW